MTNGLGRTFRFGNVWKRLCSAHLLRGFDSRSSTPIQKMNHANSDPNGDFAYEHIFKRQAQ